jgi:hypothetical protein
MSNEQQELLNEGYLNHIRTIRKESVQPLLDRGWCVEPNYPTKKEFIDKCKTDTEFSKRWGLKLEERELSWEDRRDLLTPNQYDGTELNKYSKEDCGFGYISPFTDKVIHYWLDLHNIPTKLIILTYNNETIESYE